MRLGFGVEPPFCTIFRGFEPVSEDLRRSLFDQPTFLLDQSAVELFDLVGGRLVAPATSMSLHVVKPVAMRTPSADLQAIAQLPISVRGLLAGRTAVSRRASHPGERVAAPFAIDDFQRSGAPPQNNKASGVNRSGYKTGAVGASIDATRFDMRRVLFVQANLELHGPFHKTPESCPSTIPIESSSDNLSFTFSRTVNSLGACCFATAARPASRNTDCTLSAFDTGRDV